MPFDYSQAPEPRAFGELIPHNTVATVQLRIRPGGAGEGGLLKRTKNGDGEMLDCEFVVVDGDYVKRRFWDNFLLEGTTPKQKEMADSNRGRLRKILESARGIKPGDTSDQARVAYRAELKDFDQLVFIGRISIEKGEPKKDGSGENWPDKNRLAAALGPEHKEWHPVAQPPPCNGAGTHTAAPAAAAPVGSTPITPPTWAR